MLHCSRNKTHEQCSTVHGIKGIKLMNSGVCSTVHTFYSLQEAALSYFLETCGTPQLQVGPTKKKIIFLPYQTFECVWYCGCCCGCGFKKVVL